MVVVALEPHALTPLEALHVPALPVPQDTPMMECIAWVSQINNLCNVRVCPHHDSSFVGCYSLNIHVQIQTIQIQIIQAHKF